MRITEEKLQHLALLALEDAADRAMIEPVQRTFGVRLALAYLATTKHCERWPFDAFWRWLPTKNHNGRYANIIASLNGIYRQIGIDPKKRGR